MQKQQNLSSKYYHLKIKILNWEVTLTVSKKILVKMKQIKIPAPPYCSDKGYTVFVLLKSMKIESKIVNIYRQMSP